MIDIKGFNGFRPIKDMAEQLSALPYDVVNTQEAKEMLKENPLSFIRIDRGETQFENVEFDDPKVYEKSKELIDELVSSDMMVQDPDSIYVYELTFQGRTQRGIVCLSSVKDYLDGKIKIHEHTLPKKEADRTNHIDVTNYHTGPIFLLYKKNQQLRKIVDETVKSEAIFDFTTDDGVKHRGFMVKNPQEIISIFENMEATYVADGHHRAKSAINVYERRKVQGRLTKETDYFLSVIFPTDEVFIMPYNRYVKDMGMTPDEFLSKLENHFHIYKGKKEEPKNKYETLIYMDKEYYLLMLKEEFQSDDTLKSLDATVVQDHILDEIFGIKDPRNDPRVEFVGGIRGIDYLEKTVDDQGGVAMIMHPTSIEELVKVADENLLMPPKSTWFEPKIRCGLFLHQL